jgi:futalosine hydrolase
MHTLLLSATPFEVMPLLDHVERHWVSRGQGKYQNGSRTMSVLVSGVGAVATAWHLGQYLAVEKPDLVIHAGIAGAFDRSLALGDVVSVTEDFFGDLGVEEADGRFSSLFDLSLLDLNQAPFQSGILRVPTAEGGGFLPQVRGTTVNKVHGTAASIARFLEKYPDVQVESMEGAAAFFACQTAQVPCLQIRSISNYVEPRNRAAWDIPLAIQSLGAVLIEMLRAER